MTKTATEILAAEPKSLTDAVRRRRLHVVPGRIVRYVLAGRYGLDAGAGEVRPAMILDAPSETSNVVDLLVFGKKSDGIAGFVEHLDVERSDAPEPGKWHWPADLLSSWFPNTAEKRAVKKARADEAKAKAEAKAAAPTKGAGE